MITYALYPFPLGTLKIGYVDKAIVLIKRMKTLSCDNESSELAKLSDPSKLSDAAFAQVQAYFKGERRSFDFPYVLHGTPFQRQVWQALCDIPYGETRSYKDIAVAIGNPKACRAVGMANNKNPISIAVPCHRVIGANGHLVGYAGGLEMKKALLELEHKHSKI